MVQLTASQELAKCAPSVSLAQAQQYCRALARSHYENFTVASWLLPRHLVPHFHAVYAYCRVADDLADETPSAQHGTAALDCWQRELERTYEGTARHPVFVALAHTIETFSIPREPFEQLLIAFRQDQHVTRYATADDVLDYCRNSANPVGRLVLYMGRAHDERRARLADAVCTGLQLANFCQDVARDWAKGRIYLPQETLDAAGCGTGPFERRATSAAFAAALKVEVDRAHAFLRKGQALVELMPAELRVDVALFVAGGLSTLAAIRRARYDVWSRRPKVSRFTQLRLLTSCWWNVVRMGKEAAR